MASFLWYKSLDLRITETRRPDRGLKTTQGHAVDGDCCSVLFYDMLLPMQYLTSDQPFVLRSANFTDPSSCAFSSFFIFYNILVFSSAHSSVNRARYLNNRGTFATLNICHVSNVG
jgi:hypothetical protein